MASAWFLALGALLRLGSAQGNRWKEDGTCPPEKIQDAYNNFNDQVSSFRVKVEPGQDSRTSEFDIRFEPPAQAIADIQDLIVRGFRDDRIMKPSTLLTYGELQELKDTAMLDFKMTSDPKDPTKTTEHYSFMVVMQSRLRCGRIQSDLWALQAQRSISVDLHVPNFGVATFETSVSDLSSSSQTAVGYWGIECLPVEGSGLLQTGAEIEVTCVLGAEGIVNGRVARVVSLAAFQQFQDGVLGTQDLLEEKDSVGDNMKAKITDNLFRSPYTAFYVNWEVEIQRRSLDAQSLDEAGRHVLTFDTRDGVLTFLPENTTGVVIGKSFDSPRAHYPLTPVIIVIALMLALVSLLYKLTLKSKLCRNEQPEAMAKTADPPPAFGWWLRGSIVEEDQEPAALDPTDSPKPTQSDQEAILPA